MMSPPLDTYLRRLAEELAKHGLADPRGVSRIVQETRDHLIDAVERGRERGLSREAAEAEAVERFGSAETVAARFAAEQHPSQDRQRSVPGTIVWLLMLLSVGSVNQRHVDEMARAFVKMVGGVLAAMVWFGTSMVTAFRGALALLRGGKPYLAGPHPALVWAHDVATGRTGGMPRRVHHMVMARDTSSLFASSPGDAVNPGIADGDPHATDMLKQLMSGAATGVVDPALISPAAREQLVTALRHVGPGVGGGRALGALTLLNEQRIRRYRATFADGTHGVWTVVHAADGTVVSLVRMESAGNESPGH